MSKKKKRYLVYAIEPQPDEKEFEVEAYSLREARVKGEKEADNMGLMVISVNVIEEIEIPEEEDD